MNEKTKTPLSPFAKLVLIMLGAAILNGALVLICAAFPTTVVVSVLYYLCRLLSLFVEAAGIGGALLYLSQKNLKQGCLFLLAGAGASGLTLLIAAVREAFEFIEIDLAGALGAHIGAAIVNFLIVLLLDTSILLFIWIIFLRKEPLATWQLKIPSVTVMAILTAYQLLSMVPDTVTFIRDYYPNIYLVEIASMIFDYIFLLISAFLGYMIIRITHSYLSPREHAYLPPSEHAYLPPSEEKE